MPDLREIPAGQSGLAYLAMLELRPHLGTREEFEHRVDHVQRPEGFRLVGSFDDVEEEAAAAAGFRTGHNTAWGGYLYVDDLSCRASHRRRGHGAALMRWVVQEAGRLGCDQVHLDSGHHRHDAHRLYLNSGMDITSHHFTVRLTGWPAPPK